MARDVLITPASGLVDFLDTSVSKASITLGTDGILTLTGGVNPIVFQTSTSGSSVLRVDGTSGTIFEVTDDLSNSLMSVNTIAGLPVFEVFADNHIVAGRYNQNDFYLDTNGNLGLGTSAPSSVLDVYEQSGKDNKLRFHSSTTGSGTSNGSRIGLNGAELFINNIENNAIKIYTQSTQTNGITILGSGLVGIGTTDPDSLLHVKHFSSTGANFILETTHSVGIPLLDLKGAHSAQLRYKDELDVIQARIDFGDSGTFNFIDVPNNSSTLYLKTGGNVGIGTVTPSQKLHVSGLTKLGASGKTEGGAIIGLSSFGETKGVLSTILGNSIVPGTVSSTVQRSTSNIAHFLKINETSGITFHTGLQTTEDADVAESTNEKMRIDISGNVGIGISDPQRLFTLYSASTTVLQLVNSTTGTGNSDGFLLTQGGLNTTIENSEAGYMAFRTSADEKMRITSAGNVGIGTTSPEDKLDVVGGLRISANKTANTNKTNRIKGEHYDITEEPTTFMYMNNFASSNILYIGGGSSVENAATQLNFYTAGNNTTTTGTARMVIIPSGNIGIGTGDPDEKLHVRGEQVYLYNDIDTNNTYFYARNSSSGNAGIKMKNSQGEWTIIANDRLRFYDDDNSIERFTILSSGNVGIGTVSPAYTLQVQGTGYFSSNLLSSGLTAQTNSNYIRESSDQIRYLSRINGRNINHNAQFINGTASGYNLYNNSGGSATSISVIYYTGDTAISTSAIPNSNGYVLKISYTSGAGNTSPGFGGFYLGTTNSETINADKNYKQKNRIIHRIWAKIPSGKTLAFASNAYGTNGSFTWLTPTGGNGDWYEYIGVQQIGYGGSFGSTSYFYVSGGSNTSFDWYVAECSLIDVDCPSDILYSPGLSIGYASGASYNSVQAGWGGLGVKNNAIIGGSVGIGNDDPQVKLHITGSGSAGSVDNVLVLQSDVSNAPAIQFSESTGAGFNNGMNIAYRGDFGGGSDNAIVIAGISTSSSSVGDAVATFKNGGNVGIGTASPILKLHVEAGTIYANSAKSDTVLATSIAGTATHNMIGSAGYWGVRTATNNSFNLDVYNGGSPKAALTVLNNGKVGIGTNDPRTLLDIYGTNPVFTLYNSIGSTDQKYLYIQNSGGKFQISKANDAYDTFTQLVTIDNDGNVGIGTTAPDASLDVRSASGSVGLTVGNTTGDTRLQISSTENSDVTFNVGDSSGLGTSRSFIFKTGNTERMRIEGGSVGIGTISPTEKLHVVGKALITDDVQLTGSNPRIDFNTNGSSSLRFYDTTNAAERMRINTSGNLGINTTSPSSKLQVVGSTSGDSVLKVDGTNGTLFEVVDDLSGSLMSVNDAAGLPVFEVFADSHIVAGRYNQNDFYLNTNGNLGLGTSSPITKLNIKGDQSADGQLYIEPKNDGEYAGLVIKTTRGADRAYAIFAGGTGTDDLNFRFRDASAGADRMVIDSSGNVGVGTTSPAARLHIVSNVAVGNIFEVDNQAGNQVLRVSQASTLNALGMSDQNGDLKYSLTASSGLGGGITLFDTSGAIYLTSFASVGTTFNEAGSAVDFRIEGDTDANLFFVDASTNRIGIGTASPSTKLQVNGDATVDGDLSAGGSAAANRTLTINSVAQTGRPAAKINNPNLDTATASNGRTFHGWLPIDLDGTVKYIPVYN
jgi:hypothetical protein